MFKKDDHSTLEYNIAIQHTHKIRPISSQSHTDIYQKTHTLTLMIQTVDSKENINKLGLSSAKLRPA